MNNEDTYLNATLGKCALGDQSAFIDLYNATSSKLFALVYRIVKNRDTAEDILQQGYLKIWREAGRFDKDKGRAFTWMLVIMRNKSLDILRQKKRERAKDIIDETVVDKAAGPSENSDQRRMQQTLLTCLNALPANMAQVLRMRYLEGFSGEEIAHSLKISANTVRSWIRRGLQRLKAMLDIEFDVRDVFALLAEPSEMPARRTVSSQPSQ